MTYIFIAERCGDLPTRAVCRVMKVSSSAFYAWQKCPVSDKTIADAELTNRIFDINRMARRAYGSDRVRDELRLGCQVRVGKTRVERLMRQARIVGLHKPAFRPGCTRRDGTKPSDDLETPVHRERPRPVVGHGHDRTPDPHREGLPRRRLSLDPP